MAYDYKMLRSKSRSFRGSIEAVDTLPIFGTWVPVSMASKLLKKSATIIRIWVMSGKIPALYSSSDKKLFVDITDYDYGK